MQGMPVTLPLQPRLKGQYNNSLRNSRRRTPYQPATITRDGVAENVTPEKKKIIGFNYESKLCKRGELARTRGLDTRCPGHQGCTATILPSCPSGDEKRGGAKLANMLISSQEPLSVNKLTEECMKVLLLQWLTKM